MSSHVAGLSGAAQTKRDAEPDGPVADFDPYPRYEPAIYNAECCGKRVYFDHHFRRWNCRLEFTLLPDGGKVFGFLNLGSGAKPHAGPRSEYRRAWLIANGGEPPRRRQIMSANVFVGKIFDIEVGDVTRSHDGSERVDTYSIVRKIQARTYP